MYDLWEPHIHAFSYLDRARLRKLPEQEGPGPRSAVDGWLVGVKDIIDTEGMPTERGSGLFKGRVPVRSAELVENLQRAGAAVFGKTVTAELACFTPGPTRNPWDVSRTPGGSSMGSAAAVAARIVRAAVGTQTNGSVIRPAAYCGVVGLKPTYGSIPTAGSMEFSPSLDTIGAFAVDVQDAALLAGAMAGDAGRWRIDTPRTGPLLGLLDEDWSGVDLAVRSDFRSQCERLMNAGARVVRLTLPWRWDQITRTHRIIQAVEGARSLGSAVFERPHLVSERLRDLLAWGMQLENAEYMTALSERDRVRAEFEAVMGSCDVLLTVSASGEAPTPETTGDPRFCTPWTLIGAPALALPTSLGPSKLPLGVQIVGAPGSDRQTIAAALWVERTIGRLPAPAVPSH